MENLTLDFNNFGSRAALGTYEKCDSLTLTIVLDEKDYAGYKFKIVAKKSDGHIIEQDIKEQDINREERIIKTELNNQFTTKEGVVKLEINMIKDGKEDTTKEAFFIVRDTINGEVVESTSIIPTLEGVKAFIDEAVISLGDLEQAGEDIALINGEFKEAEIKRKANELLRERSEKERVRLESVRTTEEADRIKAEAERKEAENNRKVAESNRKLAENTRKTNEAARVEAELNRQSLFEENEEIRNENENLRIEAEKERKLAFSNNNKFESERVEAEKLRAIAEDKRVTAEKVRAKAEEERVKAETRRENTYTDFNDSEVERRNNEANRVRAEAERVNAESGRNELFNTNEEKRNSTFIESERTRERAFNEAQSNRNEAYEESERVREEAFKVSEVARNEAEEGRVAAELLRVEAEKLRVAGEENRNNTFTQSEEERKGVFEEAENTRKVAESKRVAAETGRVEAEKLRVTAETERVEAENLRATAEEERVAAETKREEGFNKFDGKINANTKELKAARSATTGEKFNSLDERIDHEVDRLNKKIDVTMLQQEDKESHTIENSVEGLTTNMIIKGKTMYKKTDGTYTDTWEEGCILESFGEKEDKISILSHGKNLWNKELFVPKLLDENSWGSSGAYRNNIQKIYLKKGEYKITTPELVVPPRLYPILLIKDNEEVVGQLLQSGTYHNSDSDSPKTVARQRSNMTIKNDGYYFLNAYFGGGFSQSNLDKHRTILEADFQIEESTIGTSYEPYKEYKKDILLSELGFDEGLKGLNSTIYDELNDIRNVAIKRVEKYNVTGHETISSGTSLANTCLFHFNINRKIGINNIISDKFKTKNVFSIDEEGIFGSSSSSTIYVRISKSKLNTQDIEGFKKWLKENPTTIYYELAEPVETPLDENINVKSFNEKTYISFENAISGTSSFKAPVNTVATIARLNRENRALEEENAKLKAETYKNAEDIIITNEELQITQSAVDHLLFSNLNADGAAMLYNGKKKGGGSMGAYLAMRIIKGKLKYEAVMKQYGEFKEDIDLILEAEGYGHLITQQ